MEKGWVLTHRNSIFVLWYSSILTLVSVLAGSIAPGCDGVSQRGRSAEHSCGVPSSNRDVTLHCLTGHHNVKNMSGINNFGYDVIISSLHFSLYRSSSKVNSSRLCWLCVVPKISNTNAQQMRKTLEVYITTGKPLCTVKEHFILKELLNGTFALENN